MSDLVQYPVEYAVVKAKCREGLSSAEREYWWPVLAEIRKGEAVAQYPDVENITRRLVAIVADLNFDQISSESVEEKYLVLKIAVERSLGSKNGIKEMSLMTPLLGIVCKVIPSISTCYLIACDLSSSRDK
jgi:hypothetical protein